MPYPFYDRWGDSFNLSTEFVILHQARALGYLSWLMAQTSLKNQPWKAANGQILFTRPPNPDPRLSTLTAELSSPGLDLQKARIVWEANDHEPAFGPKWTFTPGRLGSQWIEAEAQLPDGRRVFGVTNFNAAATARN